MAAWRIIDECRYVLRREFSPIPFPPANLEVESMNTSGEIAIRGMKVERVDKRVARRLYNLGSKIYLLPCNCRLGSYWFGSGCPIDILGHRSFEAQVNEFEYYNCDNERGRYASYYIKA